MRYLLVTSLALALAACSDSPDEVPADAADLGDAPSCSRSGFTADNELAERDDELGVLFYTANTGTDRLTIDFYFPLGTPDSAHSETLTGEGLDTCATCIFIKLACGALTCQTSLMVQSGQLDITSMGAIGEPFTGSLSDAVFAEVMFESGTQRTTVVPGGETWCFENYAFSVQVTSP